MSVALAKESPTHPLKKRLFTVDEYHRMGEAGVFGPEERVELIEGEIIPMAPIGSGHAGSVNRLNHLFMKRLKDAIVGIQNPFIADDMSEPQPDVTILKFRDDYYATRHPRPQEVLLLVEVSDSTVQYDRSRKGRLYARRGVREYWIINLRRKVLEVYRRPGPAGYESFQCYEGRQKLNLLAFPSVKFSAAEILGATDRK